MCKDDIEAWGKWPLLMCTRNAGSLYNYYKLSKTCHHTRVDSSVTPWGCEQPKAALQDHWLVQGLSYCDKDASRGFGAVYQASTRPRARWILLYSLHHRIWAIVQTEDGPKPSSNKLLLCCVTCYLSQNKSLCWYPYLVIINIQIINVHWLFAYNLRLPYYIWLLFVYNLLHHLCHIIYEKHITTHLLS